jgi:dextranase
MAALDLFPDKAFYYPGEAARITVRMPPLEGPSRRGRIRFQLMFLADEVLAVEEEVALGPGAPEEVHISLPLPPEDPRGYGVDAELRDTEGKLLARGSTALDILRHWTVAPRYGFLSDFPPNRPDIEEAVEALARFHINGLQFYDWMYRHEDLLTEEDPYRDPLGRLLSRRTVDALIEAAHRRNIAAMAYAAVYGASAAFARARPGWTLRGADGHPIGLGEDFLSIMDPRPGSPWAQHLLRELAEVMQVTRFDGIHLDQYGEPWVAWDAHGRLVDLASAFPAFIEQASAVVRSIRPDATVVFNAVNNWPIETVARTPVDFLYIEVWPPHTAYSDLWRLIVEAQRLGGGKPVVLAAYIDPAWEVNVRLADAVIFASGGYHIELGERDRMLADPYFPKHRPLGEDLREVLRRYYDFAVRYENVLALGTWDSTDEGARRVLIEGINTDPEGACGKVWIIARQSESFETISLINLSNIPCPEWNSLLLTAPTLLNELRVRYYTEREVKRVWLASPDFANSQALLLEFKPGWDIRGNHVEFTVPRLEYWDLIVIEFAN